MPLPRLVAPEYELTLPSNKNKVVYRPFLVKEEKILLIAMETGDEKSMINAVKTIIKNCTNLKAKVEELPTFDIEYLFLKIRAKSVGETVKLQVTCPDDEETTVDIEIPIDDIEVQYPKGHTNKIILDEDKNVGVIMKYPSLDSFIKNNFASENEIDNVFEIASTSIHQIFSGDEVWEAKEQSKKELLEFLESMTAEQFQKVQNFFETMPKLSHEVKIVNPNTEVESTMVLEGLGAFFA
jgi:hypothetical protein